jgi:hypothetical protein
MRSWTCSAAGSRSTASATDIQIAEGKTLWDRAYAIIKAEKDDATARTQLRAIYDGLPSASRAELEHQGGFDAAAEQLLTPWFRRFVALDPRTFLGK